MSVKSFARLGLMRKERRLGRTSGRASEDAVTQIVNMFPMPFFLALARDGNNSAARIAIMAMTTSNSTSVNAQALPPNDEQDLVIW